MFAQRRRRLGGGFALVALLVVVAGALLWGATQVSRGGDDGEESGIGGLFGGGDDDADAGSGWAPVVAASLDSGQRVDLAGSVDDVALATLAATVESAPVAVSVDTDTGPRFAAAADLATSLQAPLLVTTAVVAPADDETTATPSTTPTASPSASTTSATSPSAAGSADDASPAAPVGTAADLLTRWGTDHVVAIGTPPPSGATVHAVEVTVAAPSPSASAAPGATADPTSAATASTAPAQPTVTVDLPDQVTAMLDDAAAAGPTGTAGPTVVARADESGSPLLRADVVTTLDVLGTSPVLWTQDDPRRDEDVRAALSDGTSWVLAVPDEHRPAPSDADWNGILLAAATAPELPGGGLVLFPDRVFVASYGNPSGPALGVLGERDVQGSIAYTKDLASQYDGLFGEDVQVQPAFEIIVTIASAGPEPTGDYSRREDLDLVTEWVDAATEEGLYVVLDLQPGRTDFLTQAKEVEELLIRPNVGLALDPEWRLKPDQVHLQQIGTVTTAEVNQVSEWLAGLVVEHNLPQKLLIIHNFRLAMLTEREDLVDHPELATMVHVDGQGAQPAKDATYEVITSAGPDFLWWGWKNFYDEDVGLRSPQDTAAVEPQPNFISYQ